MSWRWADARPAIARVERSGMRMRVLRTRWAKGAIAAAAQPAKNGRIEVTPALWLRQASHSVHWHVDPQIPRWRYIIVLRIHGTILRTRRYGAIRLRKGMVFELDTHRPHCVIVPRPPFIWTFFEADRPIKLDSVCEDLRRYICHGYLSSCSGLGP